MPTVRFNLGRAGVNPAIGLAGDFRTFSEDTLIAVCSIISCQPFSASIVQDSVVGSASSDLRPISSLIVITTYADDTYLIIPASNYNTCEAENRNIEQLVPTLTTLDSIVPNLMKFHSLGRDSRKTNLPPAAVEGFARVQETSARASLLPTIF